MHLSFYLNQQDRKEYIPFNTFQSQTTNKNITRSPSCHPFGLYYDYDDDHGPCHLSPLYLHLEKVGCDLHGGYVVEIATNL